MRAARTRLMKLSMNALSSASILGALIGKIKLRLWAYIMSVPQWNNPASEARFANIM